MNYGIYLAGSNCEQQLTGVGKWGGVYRRKLPKFVFRISYTDGKDEQSKKARFRSEEVTFCLM